jgi:hypothetical protein
MDAATNEDATRPTAGYLANRFLASRVRCHSNVTVVAMQCGNGHRIGITRRIRSKAGHSTFRRDSRHLRVDYHRRAPVLYRQERADWIAWLG